MCIFAQELHHNFAFIINQLVHSQERKLVALEGSKSKHCNSCRQASGTIQVWNEGVGRSTKSSHSCN